MIIVFDSGVLMVGHDPQTDEAMVPLKNGRAGLYMQTKRWPNRAGPVCWIRKSSVCFLDR